MTDDVTLIREQTGPTASGAENGAGNQESPPGTVLMGRFEIEALIGRGGMGVVYRARDLQMQGGPAIAIKLLNDSLRSNPDAEQALQRECRKVRMLAHDSIVRVFEFHRDSQHSLITMELLEGSSLEQVIKDNPGGMPVDSALRLLRAAAGALSYAHEQMPPFVHSDLKPSNLFVTHEGRLKVLDFGVARAALSAQETVATGTLFDPRKLGALTPAYASCEMLANLDPDPRDDVYALACVAYEMLSGRHPFGGRPADQALNLGMAPKPVSNLNRQQNAALTHGLSFARLQRTTSVREFVEELSREGSEGESGMLRTAAIAGGVVVLAAIAAAVFFWMNARRPLPPVTVVHRPPAVQTSSSSSTAQHTTDVTPVVGETVSSATVADVQGSALSGMSAAEIRKECARVESEWDKFDCDARRLCYQWRATSDQELAGQLEATSPDMAAMVTYRSQLNSQVASATCNDMDAARSRAQSEFRARYPKD